MAHYSNRKRRERVSRGTFTFTKKTITEGGARSKEGRQGRIRVSIEITEPGKLRAENIKFRDRGAWNKSTRGLATRRAIL